MKALLIDPFAMTITEVDDDFAGNLDVIYRIIGCSLFATVYIGDQDDSIFVDGAGLLRDDAAMDEQRFFHVSTERGLFALAGKGLVLGRGDGGATTSPRILLHDLRLMVSFPAPGPAAETGKVLRDTPPVIVTWRDPSD